VVFNIKFIVKILHAIGGCIDWGDYLL